MTTNILYEHLRARSPRGLPRDEAIQLFLWLYCTTDFLPKPLRQVQITKELLIDAFERLEQDCLILPPRFSGISTDWAGLVERLLSRHIEIDFSFEDRLQEYL